MRFVVLLVAGGACAASVVLACGDDDAGSGPTDGGNTDVIVTNDAGGEGGPSLPPGTLTLAQGQPINGIAVDPAHVYWTEGAPSAAGAIRRVPIVGGNADTLATTPSRPSGIALDPTHVYVATDAKNVAR